MFFWRRVASQVPEEGLKSTATPGYTRNVRELNDLVSRGKSFSGYERNPLFLNLKGKRFADVGGLLGVDFTDDSRAIAVVDWDRDGDLDMWVTNRTAPQVRLLQNNQPVEDSFVAIRLIGNGKTTNRDAIGARLTLTHAPPGERPLRQIRTVHAGDGFLAQSSSWTHFGLGPASDDLELSVSWPGGGTETFSDLKPGTRYTITQGEGRLDAPSSPALPTPGIVERTVHELPGSGRGGFWVANRVPFPKLTYTDAAGASRETTDFLGGPVLINLWATWCAPCIEELGVFGRNDEAMRSRGATILALNVDGLAVDGSASVETKPEEILARAGYDLPHGFARQDNLAKIEVLIEFLSSRRAPLTIPTSVLVDASGEVAAVYQGAISWDLLSGDLALLNASPAAQLERASPRGGRWFADPRAVDRDAYLGRYATLFATNGFPEESQRLYQMITPREGGKDAHEYYNQAKAAAQQGLTEKAMEYYRAAIRLDPEYGQALAGLGAMLLMQKRMDEAQPLFEKALRIDPNHATALMNLAMIDQRRGAKESALGRLRKVIARNPEYFEAHLNLGSLLASMKNHEEAIQHLSKAGALNPKSAPAQLNLAAAYMETQQYAKADAHYRRALAISPRMAYAHYGLGVLQARRQLHADAVASFRAAIALGGKNPRTYTQLGRSLLALDQKPAAVEAIKSALELDPDYPDAKRALLESASVSD